MFTLCLSAVVAVMMVGTIVIMYWPVSPLSLTACTVFGLIAFTMIQEVLGQRSPCAKTTGVSCRASWASCAMYLEFMGGFSATFLAVI